MRENPQKITYRQTRQYGFDKVLVRMQLGGGNREISVPKDNQHGDKGHRIYPAV